MALVIFALGCLGRFKFPHDYIIGWIWEESFVLIHTSCSGSELSVAGGEEPNLPPLAGVTPSELSVTQWLQQLL